MGETTSAIRRIGTHLNDEHRKLFSRLYLIKDDTFNKSATLDLESSLIEYISGDGTYTLQNNNRGLRNHNYYDRERYWHLFEEIWDELRSHRIVTNSIRDIRNSDRFKYSPYKVLTDDQAEIVEELEHVLREEDESVSIVEGEPGSGKTILAIYLVKYLLSGERTANMRVAIVLPQTSLRETVRQIFRNVAGLKMSMVLGPTDVANTEEHFDVIIVDEAHRLNRRRNLSSYATFDTASRRLGLNPVTCDQLDWILQKARHRILLYDGNQSVRPSDVDPSRFVALADQARTFVLRSQVRVLAGDRYISYIDDVLRQRAPEPHAFPGYEFRLYARLDTMVSDIQRLDAMHGLCRLVAGYAWDWKSRGNSKLFDIEIGNCRLRWNATTKNWINSASASKEVGCIHTVQGYDLNYVGVIIGPEISLQGGRLRYHPDRYRDRYGKHASLTPTEMVEYILNIYKTLMTRGIRGTFVYSCDPGLSAYLSAYIPAHDTAMEAAAEPGPDFGPGRSPDDTGAR